MKQSKPMTKTQFKKWRKRMGLSQPGAARALGVAVGTVRGWEYGRRAISNPISLLCAAIESTPSAVPVDG